MIERFFLQDRGYWYIVWGLFDELFREQEAGHLRTPVDRAKAALCIEFGLYSEAWRFVPLVDDSEVQPLLYRQIRSRFEDKECRSIVDTYREAMSVKHDIAVENIALEPIPQPVIKNPDQLQELRERHRDDLEAFRAVIGKLVAHIDEHPYDEDFLPSIRQMIQTDVNPAIVMLRRTLHAAKTNLIRKDVAATAESVVQATGIALGLSFLVVAGMPIYLAVIATVGLGAKRIIKKYIEYWSDSDRIRTQSGFSLFV